MRANPQLPWLVPHQPETGESCLSPHAPAEIIDE